MNSRTARKGFTIVETVIATAIVASTSLILIALLGQITNQTGKIAQGAAIRRAVASIRHFMQGQDFEEIYLKVKSGTPMELIVYDYHAIPDQEREDGTLAPSSESRGMPLVSGARWLDDPILSGDLAATPDYVFRAELEFTGKEELPETSSDFPEVSISLELTLWEVPGHSIEARRDTRPDHTFHVHVFR